MTPHSPHPLHPPKASKRVETFNALPLESYQTHLCPSLPLKNIHLPHPSLYPTTTSTTSIPSTTSPLTSNLTTSFFSAKTLSPATLDQCLSLISQTSRADYESSSFGWSAAKKRREMLLPDLRYIIVHRPLCLTEVEQPQGGAKTDATAEAQIEGFISFMLTYEDGKEVIYCYEIHLVGSLRGQGLGGQMMQVVEEVGRRAGMEKVMLTVLKSNEGARKFYERLGFGVDDYSPRPRRLRGGRWKEYDYCILSKSLTEKEKKS